MPKSVKVCESLANSNNSAKGCKGSPKSVKVCQSLRKSAKVCQSLLKFTKVCHSHAKSATSPHTKIPLLLYNQFISPSGEKYLKNCHSQRKYNCTMSHRIIALMNPSFITTITNCNQVDRITPLHYYESNTSNSQHQQ